MILRSSLFCLLTACLSTTAFAANLFSRADGTWSLTNGGANCGCTPGQNDNIYVNHDIALAGDFTVKRILEVNSGATLTINGTGNLFIDATGSMSVFDGAAMVVNNDLEFKNGSSILVEDGATLSVGGDLTNRNNSSDVTFDGNVSVTGDLNNGNGGDISGTGTLTVGGNVNNNGTIGGSTGNDTGSLPVEILYFRANAEEGEVLLAWATEWEENFAYFTIERSLDGRTFDAIGTVEGSGTPTVGRAYRYTDEKPYRGRAYYRLKATDHDGFEEYHGTISTTAESAPVTVLPYPNPVSEGSFTLEVNIPTDESGKLMLINTQGKTVWLSPVQMNNTYTLPKNVPAGAYLLIFTQGQHRVQQRIAIQ